MDRKSIGVRGDSRSTPTPDVDNYFDDRELRDEFAALISGYTPRQLAKASGCTTDAAKMWLAGRRVPNLASAFNMGRRLPVVRDWVREKVGAGHAADAQTEALREMVAEVRDMVKKPAATSTDSPAPRSGYDPHGAIYNMFDRRRA